jgi:pyruvate kinase
MQKTKIIATLGPNSQTIEQVCEMIEAGMAVARINLSHGEREDHLNFIKTVKEARKIKGSGTAIMLDTKGPEIRVCDLSAPIDLVEGDSLIITTNSEDVGPEKIHVSYTDMYQDVHIGGKIILDDGHISLEITAIEKTDVHTRVITGGTLISRKRVTLPDVEVKLPPLSEKDSEDITFGVEQDVDFIAASFIQRANDVWAIRHIIEQHDGHQAVIAKIENRQGVDNMAEILAAAEGLMVARGDLGVELPAEEVPVIQKQLIREANRVGKPVITATQMLESMILHSSPTRAEANDITNAIFDGTDAIMLSGETAIGKYPIESIRFMARCAKIAEMSLDYEDILATGLRHKRPIITDAISYASCATAADLNASAIITATTSGSTARMVARYRPKAPVIAVSPHIHVIRLLQLIRGVVALPCATALSMDEQLDTAIHAATTEGHIKNGDLVVITAGMPLQISGTTNMLKVHIVEDICFTGKGIGTRTIEGVIHIVDSISDFESMPDDAIIVVSSTSTDMIPFMSKVKGIIAEQAGLTSHAAMLSREMDIPAIVAVKNAIDYFQNGQKITMDCQTGHISYDDIEIND